MKLITVVAIISGLLLALFLWLRPVIGEFGTPTAPDVHGRASRPVPDGTVGGGAVFEVSETTPTVLATTRPSAEEAKKFGITHDDEIERLILDLVNEERAKAKLVPLQAEPTLKETARSHSDDMFVRGFFAHEDPDSLSPADRIAAQHRRLIGLTDENIWMGINVEVADRKKMASEIMREWMGSQGHRAKILKKEFTHIGVGVAIKGREVRATQNFAMIRALIDQPIPPYVRSGEHLNLVATPVGTGPKPERYDIFLPDKGVSVEGSRDISDGAMKVPAGVYKLRFYFPKEGGYVIYWGPQIEVK